MTTVAPLSEPRPAYSWVDILATQRRVAPGGGVATRVVDTGGGGTPVVLVHGLAASIEIWEAVAPLLAARRRVIAFDLPGFGEADKPDADYRALFFVEQFRRLLDTLGVRRTHLVGSSMGASLLVRYAFRYPETVDRIVMASPGGFTPYIHPFLRIPTLPVLGGPMSRPRRPVNAFAVRLAMADKRYATRELIDLTDRQSRAPGAHRAFVRTLRGIANPLRVKELDIFEREAHALAAPTLVVWGRQDRIFPVRAIDAVRRIMPHARIEVLDPCGHYPQIEQPRLFVKLVDAHLEP